MYALGQSIHRQRIGLGGGGGGVLKFVLVPGAALTSFHNSTVMIQVSHFAYIREGTSPFHSPWPYDHMLLVHPPPPSLTFAAMHGDVFYREKLTQCTK